VSVLTLGFWGIVDQSFQWIGRGASRILTTRSGSAEENAVFGGALISAVFGGVIGFALSDFWRSMAVTGGALVGVLLGACIGVFFGSFAETVDETINSYLASLRSK